MEVIEEVLEVAEFNCFEFARSGVDQHVEQHKSSDEDYDVEEDLEVDGQGFFEEKADHECVFGLAEISD